MQKLHMVIAGQSVVSVGLLGFVLVKLMAAPGAPPTAPHGAAAAPGEHGAEDAPKGQHDAKDEKAHADAAHAAPAGADHDGHAAAAHAPAPAAGDADKPGMEHSAKEIIGELMDGNERFAQGKSRAHDYSAERVLVAGGQHPSAVVVTCSDSRVSPELLFDQGLGSLFVVRNEGNVAEPVGLGSIEYAVEHLHAKVIMVIGHEKCGAVTAATAGGKMESKNLDAIVSRIVPSLTEPKKWASGPELVHRGVQANVAHTADELLRQSPVLTKLNQSGEITIVRAVYDLETGVVHPVP